MFFFVVVYNKMEAFENYSIFFLNSRSIVSESMPCSAGCRNQCSKISAAETLNGNEITVGYNV